MPRLFTGLQIPDLLAQHLMLLRADIYHARWIKPENYHVTLRFLGDISERQADEYISRIGELALEPFELTVSGVDFFGTRRPTLLYASIKQSDSLNHLHAAHEKAAIATGLEPEPRKFTPHITLARLHHTRPENIRFFLANFASFKSQPFTISKATLFSAKPSTGGGPYVIEDEFPFQDEQ